MTPLALALALSLPLRFWVNILRNPHFIFDVHVNEVVDASLHVIAQTFMDACTKTEHKLSRVRPSARSLTRRVSAPKPIGVFRVPPVGVAQQQVALRQGDLHLQEDGGRVSLSLERARAK